MFTILALAFALADTVRFPTVTSENLEGTAMTLPADFAGERNIVFVAFERRQQDEVDTWVPFVKGLVARTPNTDFYEIPTIKRMMGIIRWTINRGMRGGIPDVAARERTVTLYIEKEPFKRSLAIATEETIQVLIVDRAGSVLWRTTGAFTAAKAAAMESALAPPRRTTP
jgi:hypothetical protein